MGFYFKILIDTLLVNVFGHLDGQYIQKFSPKRCCQPLHSAWWCTRAHPPMNRREATRWEATQSVWRPKKRIPFIFSFIAFCPTNELLCQGTMPSTFVYQDFAVGLSTFSNDI